jgi:uroporphyrinogen decarboxylase
MAASFQNMRVLSFESRLSDEMRKLIERFGGQAISAPSMRELPAPHSPQAEQFADDLISGRLDMVVFTTGVGARTLMSLMERKHPRQQLVDALAKTITVARGPKPVAAMREWRLAPTIEVPEPNTWRDILTTLDRRVTDLRPQEASVSTERPLAGLRIAVQEYGQPNERLNQGLRERGGEVTSVSIYSWALPEDLEPLQRGIQAVADGQAEIVLFTSAQQVRHVLQVAGQMDIEPQFREGARRTLIGSVGPTCSEALHDHGLGVDFEPDGVHMGNLIRGLARSAQMLLARKRASHTASVDVTRFRRIDAVWPSDRCGTGVSPVISSLHDSPFMRACRCEPVPYTPIWLMRQAGRYQREYRELRAKVSFLELCKTPELAAEVTLMAVDQLDVDAAIIFADILLIVEPMGVGLAFNKGEGPSIARPVRTNADVDALRDVPPESLSFVYDAIRLTRRALKPDVPLIGFAGAPFTVASYMIEGGSSRNFVESKSLMYRNAGAWHALLDKIVQATASYLNAQIAAGAQVIQIFDSWVGCLSEADYREFVLPHSRKLIQSIQGAELPQIAGNEIAENGGSKLPQSLGVRQLANADSPQVPVIHFGADSGHLLRAMREAGGNVIGLDWRTNLDKGWANIGRDVAVQGNLDPVALFATQSEIHRRAKIILDQAGNRPGHIFNLGHGILPGTPVDHVLSLIDFVHEQSRR